ncbi:hypothetical protein WN55_02430 [Dufourea novaeangliae]|uniref:Uncharacterized protein n=1 Tax=Dufourea novaeangliae TaxID=178035 RepID=A0A154PFT2_DUFNO|nr:hypothetical protein WN55_02430 [Dufourea novaeangliae]
MCVVVFTYAAFCQRNATSPNSSMERGINRTELLSDPQNIAHHKHSQAHERS